MPKKMPEKMSAKASAAAQCKFGLGVAANAVFDFGE
jgi:hypothetical protein